MNISDLLEMDELLGDVADGYIQRRHHEKHSDMVIYGYTQKAQFENHWTHATRVCRGLIVDGLTGEIVARPFAKFFNYGQDKSAEYDLDAPILGAFDKADGSLGIGYRLPDGSAAIATRGSFHSDQAHHATAQVSGVEHLFRDCSTPLFEIIYPDNRIVLDYGQRDELVHLGWVDNEAGAYTPPPSMSSHGSTLREVLSAPQRANAEGLVAWVDPWTAVKFKQEDYVAHHRAVFSLSAKEVWRQLRADTFDSFAAALPDEFHPAVRNIADELNHRYDVRVRDANARFELMESKGLATQKDKALWLQQNTSVAVRGRVFSLMNGKGIAESIWDELEPAGAGMLLT